MSDGTGEDILRRRLASGSIDHAEYRARLEILRGARRRRPLGWLAAVLIVLAAVGATTIVAAATFFGGGFGRTASCTVPRLSGQVVNITLTDMMMMGGRVLVSSQTVAPGAVSFRVSNAGSIVHEFVVLPLSSGAAGTRPAGPDGRVSEAGSLGEASKSCGQGAGEGIAPGAASWVTLRLAAGRYELICNLPGHYAAGMYAELDVQ